MTPEETATALRDTFGDTILEVQRFRDEVGAVVRNEAIVDAGLFMRDHQGYDHLSDITAVDWLGRDPRFDVVYHFYSFALHNWFRLKVGVNEGQPVLSMTGVWPCANWAEREVYDLFGIVFEGHPDLERILMPAGWVGYPLRKDYPMTQITLPRSGETKIPE